MNKDFGFGLGKRQEVCVYAEKPEDRRNERRRKARRARPPLPLQDWRAGCKLS